MGHILFVPLINFNVFKLLIMNDINKSKKIGKPCVIKEKSGIWKVCFKYRDTLGKEKKYYYSDDLNESRFFVFDSKGKKKADKNGYVEIKNTKERESIVKKRIDRLNEDLDKFEFIVDGGYFALGDTDKKVTDLLTEFINFKNGEGVINKNTKAQYQSKINGFKKYLELTKNDNIQIKQLTNEVLNNFYSYLLVDREFTKRYRDDYHRFFVVFYSWLIDFKALEIPRVTKKFKIINKGKTRMHKATDIEDFPGLINEIEGCNYHLSLMFKFIFFTLHRIETIVSIQFKDVDLKNNLIHLSSDIVKNNQKVTIAIAEPLQLLINQYLKENKVNKNDYMFGREKNGNVGLFGTYKSEAYQFSNLFSKFKKQAIEKESKYVNEYTTLYSAKHSGVKFLLDSGLTPNQIITITGHTNVNQLGTYAKDYIPVKVQFPPLPKI